MKYSVRRINSLAEIPASEWNRLAGNDNPFLRHEYLAGLEHHDCLADHGWYPCHIAVLDNSKLVAAAPLYLKSNSIGEFVFDWQWAEAYENAGGAYYPKLVSAIPFTPVAGPRYLISGEKDSMLLAQMLNDACIKVAREHHLSGLHFLFPNKDQCEIMKTQGLITRTGYQYHWFNQGYKNFGDYLGELTSKRRKQINKERQSISESGIQIDILKGTEITESHWEIFHRFYASTFYRKWGNPRLTLPFFKSLSESMPESTLLLMASYAGRYVAGAFAMQGNDTLYGRHWGCSEHFNFLHFELCYYQTIDYCIRHGLYRLDAGVQGEHKIRRGFLPVRTWSAHWFTERDFFMAIADFLKREETYVDRYMKELDRHSAYRQFDKIR